MTKKGWEKEGGGVVREEKRVGKERKKERRRWRERKKKMAGKKGSKEKERRIETKRFAPRCAKGSSCRNIVLNNKLLEIVGEPKSGYIMLELKLTRVYCLSINAIWI